VRRPADQDVVAGYLPGHRYRQVVLPQVQDRSPARPGDVRAVVDRPQRAVPLRRRRERLQAAQLVAGLDALLPQLHDVDPVGQHGVEEVGEVALPLAGVRAEIEPGADQRNSGHTRRRYAIRCRRPGGGPAPWPRPAGTGIVEHAREPSGLG